MIKLHTDCFAVDINRPARTIKVQDFDPRSHILLVKVKDMWYISRLLSKKDKATRIIQCTNITLFRTLEDFILVHTDNLKVNGSDMVDEAYVFYTFNGVCRFIVDNNIG